MWFLKVVLLDSDWVRMFYFVLRVKLVLMGINGYKKVDVSFIEGSICSKSVI